MNPPAKSLAKYSLLAAACLMLSVMRPAWAQSGGEYPRSPLVERITFELFTLDERAPGSDNWPVTWSADGRQYTSWGDGGGFGGTNSEGRVSLGFAVIEGPADHFITRNVWGGAGLPEPPFGGKSYGILALGDTLYMWRGGDASDESIYRFQELYRSTDSGASWNTTGLRFEPADFPGSEGFFAPTFCQFGHGYEGARDRYVYIYAPEIKNPVEWNVQKPGEVSLARLPRGELASRRAWEFFAGADSHGLPSWTADPGARQPVFASSHGVMRTAVNYNSALGRYFLLTQQEDRYREGGGTFGIYEAPEPWGPWSEVLYENPFRSGLVDHTKTVFFNFSNKWTAPDGLNSVLVYTNRDNWATVRSGLTLRRPETSSSADYFPPPADRGGWRKRTDPVFLRSLGLDPEKLEAFGQYNLSVENSSWMPYARCKGILVISNGWIVGEWYNIPEAADFRTYISSNGKSFATACFGILAHDSNRGRLPVEIGPGSRVYDRRWLPEGFPLSDPRKGSITFQQIFSHTSGLAPERTAEGEQVEQGRNEWTSYPDWVVGHDSAWPQTARLLFTPGSPEQYGGSERWGAHAGAYSSVGFAHIGLVLRNLYGMPASSFLWERLCAPLGFSGVDFHAPPSDSLRWVTFGGVRITPRDYARFAYFLLRDGRWGDERLVPESWVPRFRTSPIYPNIRSNVDGFFGEQYPADMFRIAGSGLNWAFIVPSLDLIAIRTGRANNSQWGEVEQEFLRLLFEAVQ